MKRRDFLAASALLSLLSPSSVLAANKKKTATTAAAKPAGKGGAKAAGRTGAKATTRTDGRASARKGSRRGGYRPIVEAPRAAPPESPSPPPVATEQYNAISLPDEVQPQWRSYDITSAITLHNIKGKLRLWLPLAQYKDTPWQRSLGHGWQGNFDSAGIYRDPVAEMEVFYADWKEATGTPRLQLVSQVAKQDRHFDITRRGSVAERGEVLRRCLQSSNLVPTDGLVHRAAERAIGRIKDPVAQGKAIYDWVVDNTSYDPGRSGIGRGDVEAMLDSGQLSGKSARE